MGEKVFEIGSEYDWESNIPFLMKEENDFFLNVSKRNVKFLRSGRDAIRYVAKLCKGEYQTVLMPALACSSMPDPFAEEGYNVVYYKVNEDFSIDIGDIEEKLLPNSILFFMNYFGQISITDKEIVMLKEKAKNIIFVEDITHDLLKRRNDTFQSDYIVCSIRKWFAIPDGGMVIGKEPFELLQTVEDSYFATLRESAMKQKSRYLCTGELAEKEEYRNTLAISNAYIEHVGNMANAQADSINIVSHLNLKEIYELRVKNVTVLKKGIEKSNGIVSLVTNCEDSTLYYPIYVKDKQSEVQRKMAEHSIYLPVIWPLPKGAEGICRMADQVAESMLAIPCDHRYSVHDMKKIVEMLQICIQ